MYNGRWYVSLNSLVEVFSTGDSSLKCSLLTLRDRWLVITPSNTDHSVIAELPVELGVVVLEELAIVERESGIAFPLWNESEVTAPPNVHTEVDRVDGEHSELRVRFVRIVYEADHPAEHDLDP